MSDQSFVSSETRNRIRGVVVPIATAMGRIGLTPNGLTVIGFVGTSVAAVAAALQLWVVAGVLVFGFGVFDLFDGALARATGRASKFGAFLDSTLDRTGENLALGGVAVGAAVAGYPVATALAVLALSFASVVTYARAKAEIFGLKGEVGVAPRPERLVILSIGLVLTGLLGGLSVVAAEPWPATWFSTADGSWALFVSLALIAGLSAITVVQRILHVRGQLDPHNAPAQETPRS